MANKYISKNCDIPPFDRGADGEINLASVCSSGLSCSAPGRLGVVHPHALGGVHNMPPPPHSPSNIRGNKMKTNPIAPQTARYSLLLALPFLLFSLFIFLSSCDLFTGPKVDLFQVISDEVDWANAAKLTVTVAFPPEWGNSPQSGEGKCGDTRLGYEFGVEFTPLSGFGFEKWLAFKTADYADLDKNLSSGEVESSSLNDNGVTITESVSDTGARTAKVTINIKEPVTLVPWCDPRPRLTQQTNPPLNPILTPFPFNQIVNVWFNMNIKPETAVLGETVTVTGIYASNVGNSARGQPFNGDGDLSAYFTVGFPAANRMTLTPIEETASELALLSITVTVGPGVQNSNGVAMAQAEVISYQTDSREAQKAYRAEYITASRNGTNWFGDSADYPWNSPSIDRRFNQSDKKTAYLKFSVNPPEGAPSVPNKIKVVERMAYNLSGGPSIQSSLDKECTDFTLSGGVYTFTYALQTDRSGIIQILILPWYDDADSPVYPLQVNEAVSEGQYVTVVMDLLAPDLDVSNLNAKLNDPSSFDTVGNKTVHVYGAGAEVILTVDGLENLADNGSQGGIRAAQAWGLPWTMDEARVLYWYARIGEDNQSVKKTSEKLNVYDGLTLNKTWSPESISDLTASGGYSVYVKFEDSMGNVSDWKDTSLIVKYSTAYIYPVTGLQAVCDLAGNLITASWYIPQGMIGAYVSVNGVVTTVDVRDSHSKSSHSFSVPVINKSGVSNGQAVSNVQRYEISVVAYNAAGKAEAQTLFVWNIEGMTVTQGNTVILTQSNFEAALAAGSENNFVLTEDVTLSGWTPVAGNFTGKFYGNGHTVSIIDTVRDNENISGIKVAPTGPANMGLFGEASGGFIRDLTVRYSCEITRSGMTHFGGIAGIMSGTANLENTLVLGSFSVEVDTDNDMEVGGFAGRMKDSASILNAYGGLDLTVEHPYSSETLGEGSSVYMGGIAGIIMGDKIANNDIKVNVEKVTVVGSINVNAEARKAGMFLNGELQFEYDQGLNLGGLVGYIYDAELNDSHYRQGNIIVYSKSGDLSIGGAFGIIGYRLAVMEEAGGDEFYFYIPAIIKNCSTVVGTFENTYIKDSEKSIGGFVGIFYNGNIDNCYSENHLTIDASLIIDSDSVFCIGGFIGHSYNDISYCYSKGDINLISSSYVLVGGFIGNSEGITKNCFSTGNVSVSSKGTGGAGGFAGYQVTKTIENCYSLGNVFVVSSEYFLVGGLLGLGTGAFNNNFSTGALTVQNNNGGTGGLLGSYNGGGGIKNCVALCTNVRVTCPAAQPNIGRVCGTMASSTSSINYANGDMTLSSRTANGAAWTAVTPSSTGAATKDGISTYEDKFRDPAFWRGLGFLDKDWIFTTTTGMRHPILRTRDGSEMGGQR
ncbi:hypothetical protein R84B8_02766 [Treponema sp. R8-4-B8]